MKATHCYTPLISIIVPMYNVENYIMQCINSIIEQSYKNIEIILIDDGSPDNSGIIADEYSLKDKRINVIHTKNKGVSTARNLGITESKGEYIVFVDGDDFLACDYVDYMFSIVKKTSANFVLSKNCFKFPGNDHQIENDKVEIYSSEEAATALIYPRFIDLGCWNKMFSKTFLIENEITFPEQFYMGEGLNFIVTAAQLSNCIGVGRKKVYYYRKDNPNSATTAINVRKYFNALDAIDNIKRNAVVDTKRFNKALKYHRILTVITTLNIILKTHSVDVYKIEYKRYKHEIRKNIIMLMKRDVSIYIKLTHVSYCFNPKLAYMTITTLGSIKRKIFN